MRTGGRRGNPAPFRVSGLTDMRLDRDRGGRAGAALIVVGLHALLGYALLTGLHQPIVRQVSDHLALFDVPEPPPPPAPEPRPAERPSRAAEGEASPADLKAAPTPIVAPPAAIAAPSPVVVTPKPLPVPVGSEADAGSSTRDGSGSGAGGEGAGRGSGGRADGTGGTRRAERISGALLDSDYPHQALRMGIEGSVKVRFTITEDGRVTRCTILETSGSALLDQTTCRLAERRFRYRPALDASGRPVSQDEVRTYDWWLPDRRR